MAPREQVVLNLQYEAGHACFQPKDGGTLVMIRPMRGPRTGIPISFEQGMVFWILVPMKPVADGCQILEKHNSPCHGERWITILRDGFVCHSVKRHINSRPDARAISSWRMPPWICHPSRKVLWISHPFSQGRYPRYWPPISGWPRRGFTPRWSMEMTW